MTSFTPPSAPGHIDETPERALGYFIRAHRERLSPATAGVSSGSRRRTPGLRREEVAQLCGVSTTWYTWIEQGRRISVSSTTLARIATVLQLSHAERGYLFELAAQRDPDEPSAAAATTPAAPAALVKTVRLIGTPAYVLDRQWNALSWNAYASELFAGWLDNSAGGERNLLRFTFMSAQARALIVDWETRAQRLVAEFRADSIRYLHDTPTCDLIDSLIEQSQEFHHFWALRDVDERAGGRREFDHPQRGRLVYDQITFKPAQREDLKLVVLTPVNAP